MMTWNIHRPGSLQESFAAVDAEPSCWVRISRPAAPVAGEIWQCILPRQVVLPHLVLACVDAGHVRVLPVHTDLGAAASDDLVAWVDAEPGVAPVVVCTWAPLVLELPQLLHPVTAVEQLTLRVAQVLAGRAPFRNQVMDQETWEGIPLLWWRLETRGRVLHWCSGARVLGPEDPRLQARALLREVLAPAQSRSHPVDREVHSAPWPLDAGRARGFTGPLLDPAGPSVDLRWRGVDARGRVTCHGPACRLDMLLEDAVTATPAAGVGVTVRYRGYRKRRWSTVASTRSTTDGQVRLELGTLSRGTLRVALGSLDPAVQDVELD